MLAHFCSLALGSAILIAGCGSSGEGASTERTSTLRLSPGAQTSSAAEPSFRSSLAASSAPGASGGPEASASSSLVPAPTGPIDPANFVGTVDNPWFPLVPGTTFTYQGTKDGKAAVETFTVTATTKVVAGVTCVVIEDRLSLGGVPAEKLRGYYAQDQDGNVWYFGEDMQELDANGNVVATDGWHAGVDEVPPQLIMEASPVAGHSFAHGYTKNDFAVLSLSEAVKVPYGSFPAALVTKEWSPLEPTIETHKYYVSGVGEVRDVAVKGPTEELVLVKLEHT